MRGEGVSCCAGRWALFWPAQACPESPSTAPTRAARHKMEWPRGRRRKGSWLRFAVLGERRTIKRRGGRKKGVSWSQGRERKRRK